MKVEERKEHHEKGKKILDEKNVLRALSGVAIPDPFSYCVLRPILAPEEVIQIVYHCCYL